VPFKSEQQRRFLWSQHPDIAKAWAHGKHSTTGKPIVNANQAKGFRQELADKPKHPDVFKKYRAAAKRRLQKGNKNG